MENERIAPGTVVVGIDGSAHAKRALAWAAEQTALEGRTLTIVHAADGAGLPSSVRAGYAGAVPLPLPDVLTTARTVVREAIAAVEESHPGLETFGLPLVGDPRSLLVGLSETAHLMVLGSRGRGTFASMLLGSVSVSVAKHAKCPVVVTRPGEDGAVTDGVLVGADGTPESLPVLEFAFRQASLRQVPLTVMHTSFDAAAAVAGLSEKFPDVDLTLELGYGLADEWLTRGLRPRDLIVVGRRPVHLLSGLLTSSVSTSVLERSDSPVAVVPEAVVAPESSAKR